MPELLTLQDLANGHLDVKALGEAANGDENTIVTTRTGNTYPSAERAINIMFQNGGLPAEPFETKAKMQTDGAALADGQLAMVYDDSTNNGLYLKKSGAWLKSKYDVTAILAGEVLKANTIFRSEILNSSKNLFNPSEAIIGKYMTSTGLIGTKSGYSLTGYIPVAQNAKYTLSNNSASYPAFDTVNFLTSDKTFISRYKAVGSSNFTVTTPTNCAYIVCNIYTGLPSESNRMINIGETALPYESFKKNTLKEGLLSQETIDSILSQATDNNIADNYIKTSANLFNANDVISGYAVSVDGVETLTNNYAISHYIPVVAGAKYTISGGDTAKDAFINAAQYDSNKNFIQRVDTWNRVTRELTIIIPQGVAYLRFNISGGLPTQHNRMFNKGEAALPYEPYYTQLTGLTLADDLLQQINDEVVVSDKDKFIFDTSIDGTFNTDQVWTQYADFDSRKSAAVYAMYDALAAQHPDYITKQVMGNDSIGNQIAAYKFKPARAVATNPKRSPIIYLVCGTHGGENVPPLATYLMMEQVCNNWQSDKLLEALRFNVDFIIIPVSNPSGRDLGTRKNINGVDINRSFPEGFGWQTTDPESPYYGGAVPMQELESQYISQILTENPNIDICYDFHNFGGTGRDYYIWIPTNGGEKVQHMGQVLMQQMGRKWQAEFDWLPQRHDWFAGFVDSTAGAMVQDHARAKGVKFTGTFEIGRDWQLTATLARYDQTHCKTMVEAIVNWLLINLRNL
ncbi:MAG: M14 family zinc carboxypeptidase [Psychrobacter celer]